MSNMRSLLATLLLSCLMLMGCTSSVWDSAPPPTPTTIGVVAGVAGGTMIGAAAGVPVMGAAMGGIWGGAFGNIIQSHQSLVENLMYNGVEVVRVGDDIEIILPADKFFYPDSPNLNPNYYRVLNNVVRLLLCFDKVSVKVAAYTDNTGPWQRNLSLTRLQAQAVMNYLWTSGIDTRLIYAVGYGAASPIADNSTVAGQIANRRIEITLRKLEYEPLV